MRYSREVKNTAIQMVRSGSTYHATARALNLKRNAVRDWCRKLGVKSQYNPHRRRVDYTREPSVKTPRILQAVELAQRGLSYQEIAEEMGISKNAVSLYLHLAYHPEDYEEMKRQYYDYHRLELIEILNRLSPEVRSAVKRVFHDYLSEITPPDSTPKKT